MARNKQCDYTNYPLPTGSTALQDLDAYRQEWGGISRAEATRQIIIAWSKVRHGELSALGAMGLSLSAVPEMPQLPAPTERPPAVAERDTVEGRKPATAKRRTLDTSNAQVVELDL